MTLSEKKSAIFGIMLLSLLERIDYPLGAMRSVRAFTPVFDGYGRARRRSGQRIRAG